MAVGTLLLRGGYYSSLTLTVKLPYFVKCNQLFHFFEISTTCRHFWLFHKCNFHKVSYSNGWKEVSSLMSKPFANDICKLQSH